MFIAEEVGVGEKGLGEITTFNPKTLQAWRVFSLTAEISEFPES
jgi:hypothetical protein